MEGFCSDARVFAQMQGFCSKSVFWLNTSEPNLLQGISFCLKTFFWSQVRRSKDLIYFIPTLYQAGIYFYRRSGTLFPIRMHDNFGA